MTTELSAGPILDDTPRGTPRESTPPNGQLEGATSSSNRNNDHESAMDDDNEIPLTQYKSTSTSAPNLQFSPAPSTSSSSAVAATATTTGHHITLEQVSSIPRPLLVKARTTGDYLQHIHDRSHRELLIANGGPLAARKFSLSTDYGLDELRAPPILSDHPRRKSLESAWAQQQKPSLSGPDVPEKSRTERLTEDIIVGSWIIFLAIWGSLARIGLSALSTYPGQIVFPLIWSQFIGCMVMGFLLQDRTLFPKETRYVALYIGPTTGFCGSLTSFSSFMWNCFQGLANLDPPYQRNRGYNVLALCGQVVITLCGSIAGLRFGAHVAQVVRHLLPSVQIERGGRRGLDLLGVGLGVVGWAAAGIMCALIPKWRAELFTAVLAPAGMNPFLSFLYGRAHAPHLSLPFHANFHSFLFLVA
jgi:fluoride ion exporter CrcB/FEX